MTKELMQLTREQLYDKVWEQPMTKVGPMLGLSDVGLAKVCRKYDIPSPPVGYWAKLAHGKRVEKTVLPKLSNEDLSEIILFRENFEEHTTTPSRPKIVVEVPERLTKPHPLVQASKNQLKAAQFTSSGILQSPTKGSLSIEVSKKSLPRAFRIFDAVIKVWEKEGGEVQLNPTQFTLGEDSVGVTLAETVRRFEKKPDKNRYWKDWSYEATGKLSLEINGYGGGLRKTWKDGKVQVLENVLGNFVGTIHQWIEFEKAKRLDKECSARQKTKAKARRAKIKEQKELEQARRNELIGFVDSWELSQRIRNYLDEVQKTLDRKEVAPSKPEKFSLWLKWAHWYADEICPLTQSRPRDEPIEGPENCEVAELDLTSETREAMKKFTVETTDELFLIAKDEFRDRLKYKHRPTYQEITLVLEGLGYDVSERDTGYW